MSNLRKKYAHVQGVLDSGPTMAKQRTLSSSEYVRRRDEVNYRITRGQLADLFNEYITQEYESIGETLTDHDKMNTSGSPKIISHDRYQDEQEYEIPYLILDGRPRDVYDNHHIHSAHSYPYTYMKRDILPPLFSRYNNVPGCLIIVYCDDERTSREMAKTFVDRGTENIFLLNGGLLQFAAAFPSYIQGEIPKDLPPSPKPKSNTGRSSRSSYLNKNSLDRIPEGQGSSPSSMNRSISKGDTRGRVSYLSKKNLRHLSGRGGDTRSERSSGVSVGSNRSLAETIISRATSRRGKVSMISG